MVENNMIRFCVESFDLNPDDYDLTNIEHAPDFLEWMEKLNGDVEQALRLYPLGENFPTPDEPEKIKNPMQWKHQDPSPSGRREFLCPGCNERHIIVEAEGGNYWGSDILAINDRGELIDFEYILDSSGDIYNYEESEYPDTEYDHMCGDCARGFRGGMDGDYRNRIRYDNGDVTIDINHDSHVAYRPSGYFDLPKQERETIDAMIQYETPDGFIRIYPDRSATDHRRAAQNSNIRRWIRNWASTGRSDVDEYHFDFPSIVGYGVISGYKLQGGYLYVPDDPEAIEEAEAWIEGPATDCGRPAMGRL